MKVVRGEGPAPSLVLTLIEGIPDNDSMARALAGGGMHLMGWGEDRHLLAGIYDAINLNTRATGNWGKTPPKFDLWPRPKAGDHSDEPKKKVSVADLFKQFTK